MKACFLTGPVALRAEVRGVLAEPPLSHRDPAFIALLSRTRMALLSLVNATHVSLMVGSGTLANDAVAAQLTCTEGPGLILSNGEFGERLVDHARRWGLRYSVERRPWGESFEWELLGRAIRQRRPRWIWAVLTETSTGIANPLPELLALAHSVEADLCLDAVSAIGLMPVDLRGVRFATAVSGKGLASFPGLAAVFHHGQLAPSARIPRYLDLSAYDTGSVPYTHSSNLVAALDRSLSLNRWPEKYIHVQSSSRHVRELLRSRSLQILAQDENAAPGIITVKIPLAIKTAAVAAALAAQEIEIGWQSRYLLERNWLQIALMGEIDESALRMLPEMLRKLTSVAPARGCWPRHEPALARESEIPHSLPSC